MTSRHTIPPRWRIVAGLLVVSLSAPPLAIANPHGAQVRQGQVSIQQTSSQLRIHQQSQRAVIDWQSFSIDRGETTRFVQPNSAAAALNRVRGDSASQIEGMLRANGKVYLINPNGILVGPNGTIDVGGFVASTLDPGDQAFMKGGDLRFTGNSSAAVVNLGSISALDGDVVLMGASVLNAGSIRAPRGTAALAAGNDILLAESGDERVFVRGSAGAGSATNTGSIEANVAELKAHGGNIYGMAVKNEGRIAATGVTKRGGQIFLSAKGGKVSSTGTLRAKASNGSGGRIKVDSGATGRTEIGGIVDASSMNGAGGEIAVLGNEIEVLEGALILNDGATMGGSTFIGGGKLGRDAQLENSQFVTVGNGSLVSANATDSGDGGQIVLFATDTATFHGTASAQGGAFGGNGGFVELSGQNQLFVPDLVGQVRLSAPFGQSGTLLLDPANINVIHGTGGGILGTTMTDGALMDVLASFPVSIWTSNYGTGGDGDITFAADVNLFWSSPHTLTFQADRDFIVNGGAIINSTGSGAFTVTAARSISVGSGASITTTNGNLTLSANQQNPATTGSFNGIDVDGGTVRSLGSGDVTLQGRGGTGTSNNFGVRIGTGAQVLGGTSGTLWIEGVGGSAAGSILTGVTVSGTATLVGSAGAHVVIEGYGGSSLSNNTTSGVSVSGNATVSAGGAGSLSLYGVGGAGSGFNNVGVFVISPNPGISTTVTTAGGDISIVGVGGGGASSLGDDGVRLISNNGVTVVDSNGGRITVEGTGGPNAFDNVGIDTSASISSDGGDIELLTDRLGIGTHFGSQIDSGTGTTTILALTDDLFIYLGSDNVAGSALGITNTELSRINAALLRIGDSDSGLIAVTETLYPTSSLALASKSDIYFDRLVSMAEDRSLAATAAGTIYLDSNVPLATTGAGTISLTSGRNILLSPGASVTTIHGSLTLSANSAGTATGNFVGVDVNGGVVSSLGTGSVSVTGRGGTDASGSQIGVRVRNNGAILGGTGGLVSVTGYGGASSGSGNIGVNVFSSPTTRIGSIGANVQVTGTGGTGNASMGVELGTGNSGGRITAGGLGSVTVHGTGGTTASNAFLHGILMGSALIDSAGGNVTVTGIGGAGSNPAGDYTGIQLDDSTITAGGSGTVAVTGTAGTAASSQTLIGVDVRFTSQITSSGGNVSVTGTGGNTTNAVLGAGAGIRLIGNGTITAGGTGAVDVIGIGVGGSTVGREGVVINGSGFNANLARIGAANGTTAITATSGNGASHALVVGTGTAGRIATGNNNLILIYTDSISIGSAGIISSGTGSTILIPRTAGTLIDLGGADVLSGSPLTLGLTNAELDRITAGGLQIGNSSSGAITVSNAITYGNHLFLATGAGVAFNSSVTMAANRNLTVSAFGTTNGTISVSAALAASGTGTISLATPRDITLATGASLSTVNGSLTLSANQQAIPTSGSFVGVSINGATVQASGTGAVVVLGRGGDIGGGQHGVAILNGGELIGGISGALTVVGQGGEAYSDNNDGVLLAGTGTLLTSLGGNVSVTGSGGGQYSSFANRGVHIRDGATLSAGGTGIVTVVGTGGGISGYGSSGNSGVFVTQNGIITSSGGNVSVTGTGGGDEFGGGNYGVFVEDLTGTTSATISAVGAGTLSIEGTGGDLAGSAYDSHGVFLLNPGALVGSAGGAVSITGRSNESSFASHFAYGASIQTNGGDLLLQGDSLEIGDTASVSSGAGTATIVPLSSGFAIDLGGFDTNSALGLTDTELDRFTAGLVQIGNANTGPITVSAAISHGNHLSLTSGAGVTFSAGLAMAANRNLGVAANSTISLSGASAQLSASGTGAITLTTARDIILSTGSGATTVDGNLTLSANQQTTPTAGDFAGISLSGATLASTGNGSMTLFGRGGDTADGAQAGLRIGESSSLSTAGGNLSLTGVSRDPSSSGIFLALANVNAGGGTLRLVGTGAGTGGAIGSNNAAATIGGLSDTVLIESFSGDVLVVGAVRGGILQMRDSTASASVAFTLENGANDVSSLSAIGFNDFGGIRSLSYRDANGFAVSDYSEMGGINAVSSISLRGGASGTVAVEHDVTSSSGDIFISGRDLVVDGATVAAGSQGWIEMIAERAILVRDDSQLSVEDGNLELTANIGETPPLPGQFTGITLLGSTLSSTGYGEIRLTGRGGDGSLSPDFSHPGFTNPSSAGVRIAAGSVLVSSGTSEYAGSVTIAGTGGGGASDSAGVVVSGTDTFIQTADAALSIIGYGGGTATGFRNRGVLVDGASLQTGGSGELSLLGWGGQGVGMVDGIQLGNGATLQAEDGLARIEGFAGGNLGIGVVATANSGDIRSVGTGAIEIAGSGSNAAGVQIGNTEAVLGGAAASSLFVEAEGDLVLARPASVAGPVTLRALSGEILVNAAVTSTEGDLTVDGFDLTINAPLSAPVGNLTLKFGESNSDSLEPFDGLARVNALLAAGGGIQYLGGFGSGDTLTFAGYTPSAITFDFADLSAIENVVGTAFATDILRGPATASLYEFAGPNAFSVGGVAFSSFENVLGGDEDDTFAFAGSAALSGALDGGGGANTLDYAAYGTGVIVNLEGGGATGIIGGFSNITAFGGSGNIDTVTGPGSASTYLVNAPGSVQVGSASVTGFENLVGGPLNDRFVFLPGASLSGSLDGGGGADILDYSGFGAPVAISFATTPLAGATGIAGGFTRVGELIGSAATTNAISGPNSPTTYAITGANAFSTPLFVATGFQNLNGGNGADRFLMGPGASLSGSLTGGGGSDTLSYASFGSAITVEIGPNTATGLGGGFGGIETILGSSGNDRFRFLNQATIGLVDGGGGTDLLEIDDTTLSGDQTYTITANSVSRNPVYNFRNFEAVRLFLGKGNNTVNSGFFAFSQFLHAGDGFNTLNLPGVTTLNGANPIQNVHHFGFDAPRPANVDTGGLLKLQVDQRDTGAGLNTQQNFITENRFSIVDPTTLNSTIGALGNAFSAAIVAQAVVISVEGNSYLVLRPFSLDGSGLQPTNLGLAALQESLGIEANLELAAAIGFDGAIFLINPDGPYALDLSGAPLDPAILTLLNESLAIAAAAELSAALGMNLVVSILAGDGIVPTALDGGAPGAGVVVLLTEQLSDPAAAELNAALSAGN